MKEKAKLPLPEAVERALRRLNAAGAEAYVVGGAVRDELLGKKAQDWDITTSALPEETMAVFAGERVIPTGLKHGTVTVLLEGLPLEITTYRRDGAYTDHRRPDGVTFAKHLSEDVARRDFTVNALCYHPDTGVVDLVGGVQDLAAGVLRCVGTPEVRFREDALRILRALRFSAQLGFPLEEETARAVVNCRELLSTVAAERVQVELTKLLCGRDGERVLRDYGAVLAVCIPELTPMFGFLQHNPHHDRDIWEHTIAVVGHIPAWPDLRWAALLHDVGKPDCFSFGEDGVGHFYGHAQHSRELAEEILRRLRFDNRSREHITQLIRYHDLPLEGERKQLKRLMGKLGPEAVGELIALHQADTWGQSELCQDRIGHYWQVEKLRQEILAEKPCFTKKDLAVNGRDMMELGLKGKDIGRALDACLQAVLEERRENDRAVLLELAREVGGGTCPS